MRIVIEPETPEELANSELEMRTYVGVRRFALTGQSVAGDVHWSHGYWPDLLGDLKRLKCRVEWELMKEKTNAGTPDNG